MSFGTRPARKAAHCTRENCSPIERISSPVALIHWPNVGRVFHAEVPLCMAPAPPWLRLEKMPGFFSWVPVAAVVLGSAAAVRLLKKPMMSV